MNTKNLILINAAVILIICFIFLLIPNKSISIANSKAINKIITPTTVIITKTKEIKPKITIATPTVIDESEFVPKGRPIDPTRNDWIITQNNATHWRNEGISGLDFAFYSNDGLESPIIATHAGIAHLVPNLYPNKMQGMGNFIYVLGYQNKEGLSYNTIYGHIGKFIVYDGKEVKRGDQLGTMRGIPLLDGFTSGIHSHFEIWQCQASNIDYGKPNTNPAECKPIDPEPFTKE